MFSSPLSFAPDLRAARYDGMTDVLDALFIGHVPRRLKSLAERHASACILRSLYAFLYRIFSFSSSVKSYPFKSSTASLMP